MSWDEKAHGEALERALEHLESGEIPAGEGDLQALIDSYLDTFAALPLALEAESPRPEVRDNLLRSISPGSAGSRETPPTAIVPPGEARRVYEEPPQPPVAQAPRAEVKEFRQPAAQQPNRIPWLGALAAVLSLCVLGLGSYAFQLNQRLVTQENSLAELTHAVLVGHLEAEATAAAHHLGTFEGRFPAVQVSRSKLFPMHGTDESSLRGAMFVCAKHQQWYVNLKGLEPAAADREYHLWFLTDAGPVALGPIDIQAGRPYELSAQRMPQGTQGIIVSLETQGQAPTQPAGQIVLEGKTSIEI